ncbi:MAG: 2-isopropylmalate synthase, partial [Bacteroidota bacterium]|nr:2-isopropylmalate synthase [Bacteroidota bacterium]
MKIEIMDTTLRDGEQTSGIAFTELEKLHIAKLLIEELNIDRIEIASARVSEGEFNGVKRITDWANKNKCLDRIEVLGFVDGDISINWLKQTGAKVMNLLSKGSLKHLSGQLHKTPEEHIKNIKESVDLANQEGIKVNIYLEDWSNGMRNSINYVYYMLDSLKDSNIEHFMLPDTLGILNPDETYKYCKLMVDKYPGIRFDFHAHNDYDMAAANVYAAI